MTIAASIVLYLIIWWTVLFAVLPFGLRKDPNTPPQEGLAAAPVNPKLKQKLIITTAISCVIFAVVYLLIASDIISFRTMAAHMDSGAENL